MGSLVSYMDFRLGKNDTATPDVLSETELMEANNVDLSERGGFTTRTGTVALNPDSFEDEVTQAFEWQVKGKSRIVAIINKVVCRITEDGEKIEKQTIESDHIGYVAMQHKLYFSDGTKLYVWQDEEAEDDENGDDNGDGTGDDNGDDTDTDYITEVEPNEAEDCDLEPIKKCTMFILHTKSLRVFAAGNPDDPTALYFSEYNEFEYFRELSKVYPVSSEGAITGITQVYDCMLVSYNNSWWKWTGIDPKDDATWEALPIPYGCMNHHSIAVTPFSLTFLGRGGIYSISASIVNQDIVMVQPKQMISNITEGKLEKTIKSIKNPTKALAVFHDNKYLLAYNDTADSYRNNKVIVYDWHTGGIVIFTGWDIYSWIPLNDGRLLFASSNYILITNEGYSDVDTKTGEEKAIDVMVKTKPYSLGLNLQSKFLQNFYVNFKQYKTLETAVNITLIGDYSKVFLNDVDLADSLIWGRSWGKIWGFVNLIQRYAEIKKIASRFQVIFETSRLNDPVTIYGIGFEFKPLRPRAGEIQHERGLLK